MKSFFRDLNLKFGLMTALLILAVVLASQMLLMKQARVAMEGRLNEKAAFVNTYYAFLISDALQRKDDVTLQQVINRLEEDPEITSVIVVDESGEVRYHVDPEKLGTIWKDVQIQKAMDTGDGFMAPFQNSGGRALALVSPLKVQGKARPLGAVRLEFTYRHIAEQLKNFDSSFRLSIIGLISVGVGIMMIFVRRWVTYPLEMTGKAIEMIHLTTVEPNFPEGTDDFGRMYKAFNDMVLRFRNELQEQLGAGPVVPAEVERELVERLARAIFPNSLYFLADKDNKVIAGSKEALPAGAPSNHVLDLITDVNFANLVAAAFQKDGEFVQGAVVFHEQAFKAGILCIPAHESKLVKTLIVLQPETQPEKGESTL